MIDQYDFYAWLEGQIKAGRLEQIDARKIEGLIWEYVGETPSHSFFDVTCSVCGAKVPKVRLVRKDQTYRRACEACWYTLTKYGGYIEA